MKLHCYAVFDNKAGIYLRPFFELSDGLATRSLRVALDDRSSSIGRFPADFALYRLASWDDQSGAFESEGAVFVVQALSLLPDAGSETEMFARANQEARTNGPA